jgi:hypothetical protein
MAIVQISQITNRKGLAADLPQLAGAELGWSTDSRQLYIGNGTLEEGAPVIGNTEILTEFSDILNISSSYTYKGTAAGYTVQTAIPPSTIPTAQTLQQWLDQYASVKDFGAVGDGNTDDTVAINNALNQLYCQPIQSPGIRRSLFFPAGVYKVSNTINIPSYATLVGEGANNSIIQLVNDNGAVQYVAQTADNTQQTGASISTAPTNITVANMAFSTLDPLSNVFLVQCAQNCRFQNVSFIGPQTTGTISTAATKAGVIYGSTVSLVTNNIVFESCYNSGTYYGHYSNQSVKGVVVNNSKFNILYQGVVLSNVTGFRVTNNIFDNVYYEGVIFGAGTSLNATGYNIFYNVGNQLTSTAESSIIDIQTNNNVSIGDMFSRDATYDLSYPRVNINATQTIATVNGTQLDLGSYVIQSALSANLTAGSGNITVINTAANAVPGFSVNYTVTAGGNTQIGQLLVAGTNVINSNVQTGTTNVTISGNTNPMRISYTSTGNATMKYTISYFNN